MDFDDTSFGGSLKFLDIHQPHTRFSVLVHGLLEQRSLKTQASLENTPPGQVQLVLISS